MFLLSTLYQSEVGLLFGSGHLTKSIVPTPWILILLLDFNFGS